MSSPHSDPFDSDVEEAPVSNPAEEADTSTAPSSAPLEIIEDIVYFPNIVVGAGVDYEDAMELARNHLESLGENYSHPDKHTIVWPSGSDQAVEVSTFTNLIIL